MSTGENSLPPSGWDELREFARDMGTFVRENKLKLGVFAAIFLVVVVGVMAPIFISVEVSGG